MKTLQSRSAVLPAESHFIARQGIRALPTPKKDRDVISQMPDDYQALELTEKLRRDLTGIGSTQVLLNGAEATRRIRCTRPVTRIIVFVELDHDVWVEEHVIAGDISDYFAKRRADGEAHKSLNVFDLGIAPCLPEKPAPCDVSVGLQKQIDQLTSREREVLQLVAEGKANKQMASDLCISIKTVEKHRQRLMKKLGIHETAGLTRFAISTGIIHCNPLLGAGQRRKSRNVLALKPGKKIYPPSIPGSRMEAGNFVRHEAAKRMLSNCDMAI